MVKLDIITCPVWGAASRAARSARDRAIHPRDLPPHGGPPSRARRLEAKAARGGDRVRARAPALPHGRRMGGSTRAITSSCAGTVSSCRGGGSRSPRSRRATWSRARIVPGYNHQIGIEHEHAGTESMTAAQRTASARTQAWIAAALPPPFGAPGRSALGALRDDVPRQPPSRRSRGSTPWRTISSRARLASYDAAPARTFQGRAGRTKPIALYPFEAPAPTARGRARAHAPVVVGDPTTRAARIVCRPCGRAGARDHKHGRTPLARLRPRVAAVRPDLDMAARPRRMDEYPGTKTER
jgi:hypothetical protein